MISTHRRQPNPAPAQPASPSAPPPRRRRKPQNPWVLPWILQREERGCYRTLLDELITTDIPGYRNFTRMEPALFDLKKESPPAQEVNHQLQEATGSRVDTGSYLETLIDKGNLHFIAIPLEGWKNDHLQICPPSLQSTDPENWKKIEERFRNRWNVPHAVSALDGKHITITKPKKSGSEYFNYKGYFSEVLLALADYKFLWVNAAASGSPSDAQIFNHSKLNSRIENRTLGLPPPEPLGPWGGQIYTTSCWGTMPMP